jgi:hypothetical protein
LEEKDTSPKPTSKNQSSIMRSSRLNDDLKSIGDGLSPYRAGKIKIEDEMPRTGERRSLLALASEKHVEYVVE